MTRLKLTAPGFLLILAVLAAGAIFLIDVVYFHPYVAGYKWNSLRQEADRVRQNAEGALLAERRGLSSQAGAWVAGEHFTTLLTGRGAPDAMDPTVSDFLRRSPATLAWLTDADGRLVRLWEQVDAAVPVIAHPPDQADPLIAAAAKAPSTAHSGQSGLIAGPDGLLACGAAPIPGPAGEGPAGSVVLAEPFARTIRQQLGRAGGETLRFVLARQLPRVPDAQAAKDHVIWLTESEQLAVAWLADDLWGGARGYFQVVVPADHIQAQADFARRTVLVISSIAVGLSLLVIMGVHIFVAGPVVRLMSRLQQVELGHGDTEDLGRNLHGEPLALARRLQNAFERLSVISQTDQLTGLANRRHFEEVLTYFYNQARRYDRSLSLLIMDVDFFKAVNDAGGHQAGDRLLQTIAEEIRRACRKADLPARLGGDEFAVLLPETDEQAAAAMAERIRQAINERSVTVRTTEVNVTMSVGVSDMSHVEVTEPSELLALADRALYKTKQRGRNRVTCASELQQTAAAPADAGDEDQEVSRKLAGLDNEFKHLFLRAIEELAHMLEKRDPHMADHSRKVKRYAVLIAREMELPERVIRHLEIAASLHDIGMLSLPDSLLLCPGGLDTSRREQMKEHVPLGVALMEQMHFLEQEIPTVRHHHECWDGSGYPDGLGGSNIPLSARILAVADAFDAMTSPRSFREARSTRQALSEMMRAAGEQFDPAVVEAFARVAERLGDDLIPPPDQPDRDTTGYVPTPADLIRDERL